MSSSLHPAAQYDSSRRRRDELWTRPWTRRVIRLPLFDSRRRGLGLRTIPNAPFTCDGHRLCRNVLMPSATGVCVSRLESVSRQLHGHLSATVFSCITQEYTCSSRVSKPRKIPTPTFSRYREPSSSATAHAGLEASIPASPAPGAAPRHPCLFRALPLPAFGTVPSRDR